MRFDELSERLERALADGPPGADGQLAMAPRPRFGWHPGRVSDGARDGAALALWYPHLDEPHLLLTVRHEGLPNHPGQVSLPGGRVEPGESFEQAALREAEEEVAVMPAEVRAIGRLSPLDVPVSRYVIHPCVAVAERRPAFRPQPGEVQRVLEASWSTLCDPGALRLDERERRGTPVHVPSFTIDGERVWGATAMIIAEMLHALGVVPDPWRER